MGNNHDKYNYEDRPLNTFSRRNRPASDMNRRRLCIFTVNMAYDDLKFMDLLIKENVCQSRSEFIRDAVKMRVDMFLDELDKRITFLETKGALDEEANEIALHYKIVKNKKGRSGSQ